MIDVSAALRRALARKSSEVRIAQAAGDVPVAGGNRPVAGVRREDGAIQARDFIEVRAIRRFGARRYITERFWSGVGLIAAPVTDPRTGEATMLQFHGAGELLDIEPLPRVRDLTVPRIAASLSQLSPAVLEALQGHDARGARVRIWRGVFDPGSGSLIDAAPLRFSGAVEQMELRTPSEGGEGRATITCTSDLAALSRGNPSRRADGSQRDRRSGDAFYQDAGTMRRLRINWGGTDAAAAGAGGRGGAAWQPPFEETDR